MHFIYGSAKYPLHVDCYFAFPVLDCEHFCCEGRFRSQSGVKKWGGGGGMRKQGSTPDLDGHSSGNPRPCKVSFNIVVHLCSWGECLG